MQVVLQLPLRGIKSVAQRDIDILVVFVIDHDFAPRHRDVQPHHELTALMLVFVWRVHYHAACGHLRAVLFELGGLGAYMLVERGRVRHIAHGNLEGALHRGSRLSKCHYCDCLPSMLCAAVVWALIHINMRLKP